MENTLAYSYQKDCPSDNQRRV